VAMAYIIQGNILEFARRDWEKLQKTSVRITRLRVKI
jgi:hypothetical protein